jgi:CRISP-associated protein Cas1
MGYHIVHILSHGSKLSIDRGCLVCKSPDVPEKRIPKSDILAVIIAARGILFSGDCLSDLLENNCIVLHCDDKYRPIGKSIGLHRVIHSDLFEKQIQKQIEFSRSLWDVILRMKIKNQIFVLDMYGKGEQLRNFLNDEKIEESKFAKYYWMQYFSLFEKPPKIREHRNAKEPINIMLNYGYAVLGAILHRSMIVHGLDATLGIHHKHRFKSEPLLYDLIEPLRPFCDLMLAGFLQERKKYELKEWAKYIASELIGIKMETKQGKNIKLLYAIDRYVCSIVDCYLIGNVSHLNIPEICLINEEKRG